MTLEEAIKKQHELCDRLEYMQDFNEIVLAALRAQQERENPQPLTLEELRKMDGEKVYIPESEYYFDGYGVVDIAKEMVVADDGIDDGFWPFCDYSENWLAYRCPWGGTHNHRGPHGEKIGICNAYKQETNADRIRAMSDEDLAAQLTYSICKYVQCRDSCPVVSGEGPGVEMCKANILHWLQQPAKEAR